MGTGISIDINAIDLPGIAERIHKEQQSKIGFAFAYCNMCGRAVSRPTRLKAARSGNPPICSRCYLLNPTKRKSKDETLYLCFVCRKPLSDKHASRARHRAKHGSSTTCGSPSCVRQVRTGSKPKVMGVYVCVICRCVLTGIRASYARRDSKRGFETSCGDPACMKELASRKYARISARTERAPCVICGRPSDRKSHRGSRDYCERHRPGRTGHKVDLLRCTLCDKPATRSSTLSARSKGTRAYCNEHKYGRSA